jgi:hypothetical protein
VIAIRRSYETFCNSMAAFHIRTVALCLVCGVVQRTFAAEVAAQALEQWLLTELANNLGAAAFVERDALSVAVIFHCSAGQKKFNSRPVAQLC